MLLLAIVVGLRVDSMSGTQPSPATTLALADAVAQLEGGCLTCHMTHSDSAGSTSFVALHQLTPNAASQSEYEQYVYNRAPMHSPVQTAVDAQLLDLGQDILGFIAQSNEQDTEVAEAFLVTYHATRDLDTTDGSTSLWRIQVEIDSIRAMLRDLEHQASPYRMAQRTTTPPEMSSVAIMSTSSAPPAVALFQHPPIQAVNLDKWARFETHQHVMPLEIAYATHRRGPPSGVYSDSVCYGRLQSAVHLRSPFIFLEDNDLRGTSAEIRSRQKVTVRFSFGLRRSYVS